MKLSNSVFFYAVMLSLLLVFSLGQAAEKLPVLLKEDFTRGSARWDLTDEGAWRVRTEEGSSNRVMELYGASNYKPPFRSPANIALLKYNIVGDFVLTAKVRTTKKSYGHRDMCLFFGYQDPANFYYVHLGQKTDDHANQIFIVKEAPRTKISEKTSAGTPWKDETWHQVKIVREVASGLIEVYFDDMKKPMMVAHDKTFDWGSIGLGSFDDTGMWDAVELRGIKVKAKGSAAHADPKTLKYDKWTADFQIHNAIALSFDDKGVAYVTGARRRVAQDLAIRQEWMVEDLKLRSVDDKRAFYHRELSPEKGQSENSKKQVVDHNKDGSHDWRDLTVLSDTIYRLEDSNGDGKADKKTAYATDVKTEITGSMAGVLYYDGDVYATVSPELMKFRDTDGDGVADKRESIANGFGVHVAYAGHYMHGLNVGPDGRIYWTIGDKGINVTSKEGKKHEYPHEGSMMRCEPDGSNFEVFVRGLRNLQEPRFDAYGNWFGVDNDGDSPGEMERLVYLVQHMDVGWRINWQYFKGDYNFWTSEYMYKPYFDGQPGHIVPTIKNYVNGPSGFAWNPGTALSPEYKDYFFITQFSSGYQNAFQVKAKDASFEMINDHIIGNGVPLVGLNWAPDGGLYGTDWGGGYTLNDEGGVWKIDVPEYANSKERKETAQLLGEGMGDRKVEALAKLCGHADQRVRLAAQFELVKRGQGALLEKMALDEGQPQMARIHGLWGWAQLQRKAKVREPADILKLATDKDVEMRAQLARTVGDMGAIKGKGTAETLIKLLQDESARVQSFAAISLGNLRAKEAYADLLVFAKKLKRDQAYLRHAAVTALQYCATVKQLAGLRKDGSPALRHVAVLALRRLGDVGAAEFLADKEEYIATDAARAIHDDDSIAGAMPALAASLTSTAHHNEAFIRRAVNANFRLGDPKSAQRLAQYALGKSAPLEMRLDALQALSLWAQLPEIDRIEGRYRKLTKRDLVASAKLVEPRLADLLSDKETKIRELAMRVATTLQVPIDAEVLLTVVKGKENASALRLEALNALQKQKSKQVAEAVDTALLSSSRRLRIRSLQILAEINPEKAIEKAAAILKKDSDTFESQQVFVVLAKLAQNKADGILIDWAQKLANGGVKPELLLDVITAAQARAEAVPKIKAALVEFGKIRKPGDLVASYYECLEGGDAEKGKDIFMNHIAAQCVRCHKYNKGKGSTIGPNLKSVGREKDRRYILESVLNPQAVIAPGYGTISVTLKNGDTVAGQFRKETKKELEIRDADNKTIKVPLDQIKERSMVISTMPPMIALLKKHEIRDVVAYLATLKAK
ncbi:MAG: HEAT repeat domain-containing protein [Verrucomicrobiales bacterium]|nr:HEAT repeat domain-containing protein [Verrucomicrobiales bacterium]